MKVSEYCTRYFSEDSAPDRRTVISRIKRQDIIGEKEGSIWYVYPNEKPSKDERMAKVIAKFGKGLA